MTIFNTDNQLTRLFGPESHRRRLTPENNRWEREARQMREKAAREAQRKLKEEIGE